MPAGNPPNPITSPAATPVACGRRSCAMTMATGSVAPRAAPSTATAASCTAGNPLMKIRCAGMVKSAAPRSVRVRPMRSDSRPPDRLPAPTEPMNSTSGQAVEPSDSAVQVGRKLVIESWNQLRDIANTTIRASGRTAQSPARRSAQTNRAMNAAARRKQITTRGSVQAYWLPAQEKPSSSGTPAAITAAPPR